MERPSSIQRPGYAAPCPHYPDCVGCPFINLPYPEQLLKKRRLLAQLVTAYSSLRHLDVPPVVPSPQRLRYRARIKLVVRQSKHAILTGLYFPGTHRVADISSCPLHPEPVNRVIRHLKDEIRRLGITAYDETTERGDLRYLDARYSFWRKELVLTLVTRHSTFPRSDELARSLKKRFPYIAGVVQNVNEDPGNVIWGKHSRTLAGRDTTMERIGPFKLKLPVGVFSQANPAVARRLYERVHALAALTGGENVLDLYCGIGPISLYLAQSARVVWGVDESPLSIATAKQNGRLNGTHNCRFFEGGIAEIIQDAMTKLDRIDLIVLNPPRKGIQPDALAALLSCDAPRIIYVSCAPVTLTRDLDKLSDQGYRAGSMQPFDMFPQTDQVETVAVVDRRS
jgi:23S rRNA (uracil-5-)-methyltransferase RumA